MYLVDKNIDWRFKGLSFSAVHGQEAKTHSDIKPFAHTNAIE